MKLRETLVLASGSKARASVLRAAGLPFEQVSPGVDEEVIKLSLRAEGANAARQAEILAEAKSVRASLSHDGIVLGADQILDLDGEAIDKSPDLDGARQTLQRLSGRTHLLQTAVVASIEGSPVWRHISRPRLRARVLDDAFIDAYIAAAGEGVLSSVGAYQIEGLGVHLFDSIEGDQSSILGLPILPLLGWLRDRGALVP